MSQLNIEVNRPNKAFLFGINYVIVSDDQDYRDELDQMFDVKYQSEEQIELEAQLFVFKYYSNIFFLKGRLKMQKNYVLHQQSSRSSCQNVIYWQYCYLYLKVNMIRLKGHCNEALLQERYSTDIYALCHYNLATFITLRKNEQYSKYLKILKQSCTYE